MPGVLQDKQDWELSAVQTDEQFTSTGTVDSTTLHHHIHGYIMQHINTGHFFSAPS